MTSNYGLGQCAVSRLGLDPIESLSSIDRENYINKSFVGQNDPRSKAVGSDWNFCEENPAGDRSETEIKIAVSGRRHRHCQGRIKNILPIEGSPDIPMGGGQAKMWRGLKETMRFVFEKEIIVRRQNAGEGEPVDSIVGTFANFGVTRAVYFCREEDWYIKVEAITPAMESDWEQSSTLNEERLFLGHFQGCGASFSYSRATAFLDYGNESWRRDFYISIHRGCEWIIGKNIQGIFRHLAECTGNERNGTWNTHRELTFLVWIMVSAYLQLMHINWGSFTLGDVHPWNVGFDAFGVHLIDWAGCWPWEVKAGAAKRQKKTLPKW